MTMPEPTTWLVDDRYTGKTAALMAWLAEGEPIPQYPGWSRVVICCVARECQRLVASYPGVSILMGLKGFAPGATKVIMSAEEFRRRGISSQLWRHVEFAVDDADAMLQDYLGIRPTMVAASGTAKPPEVPADQYRDLTTSRLLQPRTEPEPEAPDAV